MYLPQKVKKKDPQEVLMIVSRFSFLVKRFFIFFSIFRKYLQVPFKKAVSLPLFSAVSMRKNANIRKFFFFFRIFSSGY